MCFLPKKDGLGNGWSNRKGSAEECGAVKNDLPKTMWCQKKRADPAYN